MKYLEQAKNIIFKRKRLFWLGNTLFWFIVILESVIINPETLESIDRFLKNVFSINLAAFFITCLLRLVYKKINVHRLKLFPLALVVIIYSSLAAIIWTYSFVIISHFLNGELAKAPFYILAHLFEINVISIILWSCLYTGYKIWEEWNDQKYQLEHERALLRTSQLEMLKYQLNPHFLFNTLSSLRGLITADPVKAKAMVTHISEFLRYSLLEGKNNEVQFIKEIEIIKQYLNIEQVRYNEDLLVEFDVSPETNDLMIPIFLIHPLVENAVKHGMQTSKLPLNIFIHSKIENHTLIIEVKNSGNWIDKDPQNGAIYSGIGLQNIKKRLEHSFPDRYTFEIVKEPEFVKVVIKIKFNKS
jgi:hypothetical protein